MKRRLVTLLAAAVAVPDVEDRMFRMLEPREVAARRACPGDYVWAGTPPRTRPHGGERGSR